MAIQNKFSSISFKNLWLTRKSFIQSIGIVIVSIIILILGIQQIFSSVETSNKIKSEQKKLDLLNRKIQELELVKISEEFSQSDEVDDVLPSHKPILELLNNLNNVANQTNISITEFEVRPGEIATDSTKADLNNSKAKSKENKNYDKLNLSLKIEGEMSDVQKFMNFIERVAPFTTITNLSISRQTKMGQSTQKTRAELEISSYFYTQSISATISAPLPKITEGERDIFQTIVDFTPAGLKQQTTIISGDQKDLFGIPGLNVVDLDNSVPSTEY